jgi:hypothetical protein
MPKVSTYPRLYQDGTILKLSRLKEWGYLDPGKIQTGTITWSRQGDETASLQLQSRTYQEPWLIRLSYNYKKEPFQEEIRLYSIPSNIGKGRIHYFICPVTGKKCRNLYLYAGRFIHREAVPGAMYETQTYSHKSRVLCRLFDAHFGEDRAYEQLYKKGFKRQYKGKPTKKYKKVLRMIKGGEGIDIESLLLM